ncbi:MAG: hypothetical protein LAP87_17565 [Acidobacteriia bacterium]|nr:hypothetical protein [Terriglobia bacterium]
MRMHLDGDDVAKLNNHQLRKVMNALLIVEANENGVPLADLELNTRDTDPDAGIDARVQWPVSAPHDPLAAGQTALQYKSGRLTVAQLATEFGKPGVRRTLRGGGNYLLLVAHDYVVPTRDKHQKEIARLCRLRKLPVSRCKILYGDQMARWASRHLAIPILPEFGKPLHGFATVNQWKQDPLFQNEYFADPSRKEIIDAVRSFVSSPGEENILRIEGMAGVGKSRLVLESLSERGVSEATLYAPDAEAPQVQDFLASVQSDVSTRGIMVVDECTSDRQEVLMRYARLAGPRLRLICVGPAEILAPLRSGLTKIYQVLPLGDGDIRTILQGAADRFPLEIVSTTVRVSGGYVKLALFVSRILAKQNVPLVELRQIGDVRQVLKKFVPKGTAQTLEALSLLSRVGWEDEVREEAKALAKAVGLDFGEMQRSVRELKDQGIVLPRGRYLYVSPDLLAIKAAAELWDERGADLIRIAGDLPGDQPRRHLLLRLVMMAEHREVRKAVERMLADDGLFKTIEDLDQQFLSEIFSILSAGLPRAAIEVLTKILAGTPKSRLLSFNSGRRNVMWALESLLRWPETSLEAARCLRELALAETENFANNATAIFCRYFHPFLSGSPIPFFERLVLLDELAGSNDSFARQLAVKAAAAALSRHVIRIGGDEDSVSRRHYPREWRPHTTEEFRNACRAAVRYLVGLSNGSDEASDSARQALIDSASDLAMDGLADDAVEVLEAATPRSPEQVRSRADAAGWILQHGGPDLSELQQAALQRWLNAAFGEDLDGQLKRWVGPRLQADFDLAGGEGYANADSNVVRLADRAYQQGLGDAELKWLASREAENVWPFGRRLGELDTDQRYLERIIEISPDDVNCVFLAAYAAGLGSSKESLWDQVCDELAGIRPILAFGATCRGPATRAAGERILNLIDGGQVPCQALQFLMLGGWAASLPVSERCALVKRLLDRNDEALTAVALSILHDWVTKGPRAADDYRNLIWDALERPVTMSRFAGEWHWGELAKTLARVEPKRAATLALRRMEEESSWVHFRATGRAVLAAATAADAEGVFGVVSSALLDRQPGRYRLLFALEHWYGDLVSPKTLVQWAQSHSPLARSMAARLIVVDGAPMPERLRAMLKAFPDDQELLNSVLASLGTGIWWGPYSERLKRQRDVLQSWANEQDPWIRKWAQDAVRRTERAIERQLKIEEEEGLSEVLVTATADATRKAART